MTRSLGCDPEEASRVPIRVAGRLVAAIAEIADVHAELAQRRRAVLTALAREVEADGGLWAWGRGWPDSSAVVPVAHIDFGMDQEQRTVIMDWGLDAEVDREFRGRIRAQMGVAKHVTTIRRDIFTAEEWEAIPFTRRMLRRGGWESWLHSVRYSDRDTWSNFLLLRAGGRAEFGPAEAAAVHLMLDGLPWLHSTAEEILPPEAFVGLTPRQRTVMLMILDGLSRKAVSGRLEIAEDTVGAHLKAIYAHFGVSTSGQLAALFLRNR